MKVRFLDLSVKEEPERSEMLSAFERILDHGQVIMGPELDEFEKKAAEYCHCEHALGVASGTGALITALHGLGVGRGDEVITSAMTFAATTNAISMVGATPILADTNDDLNISVASIERLITDRTRVIMPVHYTGLMCRMDEIMELARLQSLAVVEDASQAFGATLNGQYAGTFGDAGAVSLNSMKVLASLGEGGLILTNSRYLAEQMDALRYNGVKRKASCIYRSFNNRMHTMQAAFLITRLGLIEDRIQRRRAIAARYTRLVGDLVEVPSDPENGRHVYYTYTVFSDDRDTLMAYLIEHDIECKVYHGVVADEPAYEGIEGEWKNAKRQARRKLSLPCHEKLTDDEVDYVGRKIREFFKANQPD